MITFSNNWIVFHEENPPYNKPVLVTDGESCQIRIFRLIDGIKCWESLSTNNMTYSVSHWMYLPECPDDDIQPCPFCFSKDIRFKTKKHESYDEMKVIKEILIQMVCAKCEASTDYYCEDMDAKIAWNRRKIVWNRREKHEMKAYDEELKRCPFCSGKAELSENDPCIEGEWYFIRCTRCDVELNRANKDVAISEWNKRV